MAKEVVGARRNEPLRAISCEVLPREPFRKAGLKARAATVGRGYSSGESLRFLSLPSLTAVGQKFPSVPADGVWVSLGADGNPK
jgi:hypothetical protein